VKKKKNSSYLSSYHKNNDENRDIFYSLKIYQELRHLRLPFIITVLTMLIGTLGYIAIDNFSLLDAIYQTGITFTTVGFGEIAPISPLGRLFTITLIIAGFAVFTLAVGIVINELNNGEILNLLKVRSMLYKIARLNKHFVVCYHNDYTVEVAHKLRESHVPFVVIDPREDIEKIAKEFKYPYFIQAEPYKDISLLRANLSSAKGIITLSDHIADNIAMITSVRLYEKEHNIPKPYHIITSIKTASQGDKLKKLGADSIVSPTILTAQRISAMAISPDMENLLEEFLYANDTPLDMEEIDVPKTSWMVLKRLSEIKLRQTTNVTIVGIRRSEGKFISMPSTEVLITADSTLLLIGTLKGLRMAKALITRREKPEDLQYV
jgi:voltage-gated potassium channel